MKKITLLLSTIIAASCGMANAQSSYQNGIGIRFGSGYFDQTSVSFKTFISNQGALEFNGGIRGYKAGPYKWTNVSLSGTYQHHFNIPNVPGFKWFVGGGLAISNSFSNYDDRTGLGVGIYPTGGVDYKFKNIPLNLSADIRPTINVVEPFSNYYDGFYTNFGIAVRYTF